MSVFIGDDKIKSIFVGEQKIVKGYVGSNLVYQKASKPSRLPAGYTEVEYIIGGSSDNVDYLPYFNIPDTANATQLKFEFSCGGSNMMGLTTPHYVVCQNTSGSSSRYCHGFGAKSNQFLYYNGAFQRTLDSCTYNTRYSVDINVVGKSITINDHVYGFGSIGQWMNSQFGVFRPFDRNISNYPMYTYAMYPVTLYYLQLLDAKHNLLRDLVPCVKSDGQAGFYDLVTNTFFGNQNTSPNELNVFTPGPVA